MMNFKFKAYSIFRRFSYLLFNVIGIRVEFQSKFTQMSDELVIFGNFSHFTENYNAFNIECPFILTAESSVIHAERYFWIGSEAFKFVAFLSAMQVNSACVFIINIIHRKSVRVAVCALYGHYSAWLVFEDLNTFFV